MRFGGLFAAVSVVVHEFFPGVDVTSRDEDQVGTIADRKQTSRQIWGLVKRNDRVRGDKAE